VGDAVGVVQRMRLVLCGGGGDDDREWRWGGREASEEMGFVG
jgi:hypothetical protein